MGLLARIGSPADVRRLSPTEVDSLAEEIREFLVQSVSRTGGHLGPNLGVVELTLALHRVFESPRDTMVFDTGHQAYVHKLVTGRQDFSALRKRGGLSGYPSRGESEHDVVENSHASTALSWADGIAKANVVRGSDRPARRRGDRRRRPHRRHGLGGAQQHRRGPRPPPRHRRQRQRALLRAHDGRARLPPRHPAHDARVRELPLLGQAGAAPHGDAGPGRVRRAARAEEGHQGRRRPAGHVRGPRHQVRRPHRRSRHRRAGASRCAARRRSAARSSCTS